MLVACLRSLNCIGALFSRQLSSFLGQSVDLVLGLLIMFLLFNVILKGYYISTVILIFKFKNDVCTGFICKSKI